MKKILLLCALLGLGSALSAQKERPGVKDRAGAKRESEVLEPAKENEEKKPLGQFAIPIEYDAMFDYQLLPRSGGQSLTAFLHLPYSLFSDKSRRPNRRKAWRVVFRSLKTVFIDYAAADYYNTIQSTVFGLGSAARLMGRDSIRYRITPFSFITRPKVNYSVEDALGRRIGTVDEEIALAIAGVEASGTVMPEVLRQQFMSGGRMSNELSMFYMVSKVKQVQQILSARSDLSNRTENNIERYLYNINAKYLDSATMALGEGAIDSFKYRMGGLKAKAIIATLLDPTLYASAYNLYGYVLDAKKLQRNWTLRMGNWQYTPSFNLSLTPFGDEIHFHSYIIDPRYHVFHVKLRVGQNPYSGTVWALGFNVANYRVPKVGVFQAQGELWNQPAFRFADGDISTIREVGGGIGGMFTASFRSEPLFRWVPVRIFGHLGFKSAGYSAGENLDQAFIFRVGLSYPDFFSKDRKAKTASVSNEKRPR